MTSAVAQSALNVDIRHLAVSAILAVGRTVKTPVGMPDDSIALRPTMSLTLSVDHRSLDGVQGAKFLAEIKDRIEKPYFLL